MKNLSSRILMLFLVATLFTSCELIGDIFQVGMSVGILLVVAVVAVIIFIISKLRSK